MNETDKTTSGGRLRIDATKKLPGGGFKRAWRPQHCLFRRGMCLFGKRKDNPFFDWF